MKRFGLPMFCRLIETDKMLKKLIISMNINVCKIFVGQRTRLNYLLEKGTTLIKLRWIDYRKSNNYKSMANKELPEGKS